MANTKEVQAFFKEAFPQAKSKVMEVGNRRSKLSLQVDDMHLRPGGTISGPTMMTLADAAIYAAILGEIGLVALAVTTNLSINFFNKPAAGKPLIAECQLLKVGKVLIVAEVSIYSEGIEEPVAHAVGTYSIPPNK